MIVCIWPLGPNPPSQSSNTSCKPPQRSRSPRPLHRQQETTRRVTLLLHPWSCDSRVQRPAWSLGDSSLSLPRLSRSRASAGREGEDSRESRPALLACSAKLSCSRCFFRFRRRVALFTSRTTPPRLLCTTTTTGQQSQSSALAQLPCESRLVPTQPTSLLFLRTGRAQPRSRVCSARSSCVRLASGRLSPLLVRVSESHG